MPRGRGRPTYNLLQLKLLNCARLGLLEVEQIANYLHVLPRALANNLGALQSRQPWAPSPTLQLASLHPLPDPWKSHICGVVALSPMYGMHLSRLESMVELLQTTSPMPALPHCEEHIATIYRRTIAGLSRLMAATDEYMSQIGHPVQHRHLHLAHLPSVMLGVLSADAGPVLHIHDGESPRWTHYRYRKKTA